MELVRASEFIKSRKEREDTVSTSIIVGGVKVVVMVYNFVSKSRHEVFVCVERGHGDYVLHIPRMFIQKESDIYSVAKEALSLVM